MYLRAGLPVDLLKNFYDFNNNKFRHYNSRVSVKLKNKFNKINSFQNLDYKNFFNTDNSKWVVNNCSKAIPESVINFLNLGEKFAVPINVNDNKDRMDTALMFVKNFEASSHKFPERVVDKVRSLIVNSLSVNLYGNKHLKHIDAHILKEYINCKKFLKNNNDIFVTKADKGQVTVFMDKSEYVNQMEAILSDDSTYKILKNNPLRKITAGLDGLLKMWLKNNIIDGLTYKRLRCTNGSLPRCYGLPKIHKPGYPLRIIVSSLGSPLYEVAKFLNSVLSVSLKKPVSHTKDSWTFAKKIKGTTIEPDAILVSLDVASLYTNLPKELIIQAIENRWSDIQKN